MVMDPEEGLHYWRETAHHGLARTPYESSVMLMESMGVLERAITHGCDSSRPVVSREVELLLGP